MTRTDGKWESPIIYDIRIPKGYIYFYLATNTLLCLLIITINSILIQAIRRLGKLRKISFQFIFYLSISDIGVGIVHLSLQFSVVTPQPRTIDTKTLVSQFAIYFVSFMSGGMTVILAVDRYIHMKYFSTCNEIITKRRGCMMITGCIISNLFVAATLNISSVYKFFFIYRIIFVPIIIIAMVGLSFIYLRAYISIRKRVRGTNIHDRKHAWQQEIRNPEHEFAKLVVFIIASLIICYLPSIIIGNVHTFAIRNGNSSDYLKYAAAWSYTMAYLNSMTNAIIIITGHMEVTSFVKGMFRAGVGNLIGKRISSVTPFLEAGKNIREISSF